jgi:hypothetical protein
MQACAISKTSTAVIEKRDMKVMYNKNFVRKVNDNVYGLFRSTCHTKPLSGG